jgi:hypothetical protein
MDVGTNCMKFTLGALAHVQLPAAQRQLNYKHKQQEQRSRISSLSGAMTSVRPILVPTRWDSWAFTRPTLIVSPEKA